MKKTLNISLKTLNEAINLGQNVKLARKRREISISEMANKLNISRATVYRLEEGDTSVSLGLYLEALYQLGLLQGISIATDPTLDIDLVEKQVKKARMQKKQKASLPNDIDLDF